MIFNLFQPLEQFEMIVFRPFSFFPWIENIYFFLFNFEDGFFFTNSILYSIFAIGSLYFFMYVSIEYRNVLPHNPWEVYLESTYTFIYTTLTDQATKSRPTVQLVPFTFTLFFFILSANLIGLTPYGFTTTSFIIKTFILSAGLLIGLTITGLILQGAAFFHLFVPSGVPTALLPMLVFIEVVSYVSRAFSLAIRLFANMMSGHSLLNILSGFCVSIAKKSFVLALIPFLIILAISFLEVGIAILQAYVFVVLFCIYLNDALFGHAEDHDHGNRLENEAYYNFEETSADSIFDFSSSMDKLLKKIDIDFAKKENILNLNVSRNFYQLETNNFSLKNLNKSLKFKHIDNIIFKK